MPSGFPETNSVCQEGNKSLKGMELAQKNQRENLGETSKKYNDRI